MALTLTIGGNNFLPQYKTNSAKIVETLQNRGNTMSLEVTKNASQSAPEEGKEIIFKDGARFLFAGFITRVEPVEIGKGQLFVYTVEATDYTYILINKNAQKVYSNQTLAAIVADLVTTYINAGYGITTTNVDTGPTIETVSFNHISLRKAFEKLAKISGYEWWVDYEKDVHFKAKMSATAPETITDSSANHESLSIDADLSQVRNSIIVRGGKEETSAYFQQTIEADGVAREWLLREKPTDVEYVKEDTVTQDFGEDPTDEETGNSYMYNKVEKYVRVVSGDPTPTAGTDIEISYKYEVPVIVLLQDATSIAAIKALEGGDGIHEYTIVESSIKSKAEARQRALKELAEYADPLVNGLFTTRTGLLSAGSYFVPGQELTVNSPTWGISTDTKYQVQEVVTRLNEDGSSIEYHYTVRFGGRLLNSVAFLESLAGKEDPVFATEEVDTIKAITESVTVTESITRDAILNEIAETATASESISKVNVYPPFRWGDNNGVDFTAASSQYISTNSNHGALTAITIAAWIKPDAVAADQAIVSTSGTGILFQLNASDLQFWSNVSGGSGRSNTFAYTAGDTLHVAVTFTNTGRVVAFYVNGVVVANAQSPVVDLAMTATTYIATYKATGRYFDGVIDDIRIYNTDLTASQVEDIYNGIEPASGNRIEFYPMDEGTGTTVTDLSANGYVGTFQNSPAWATGVSPEKQYGKWGAAEWG